MRKTRGFTLVETLVVISIIGVLSTMLLVGPLNTARKKARDTKRKYDLAQIGRLMSISCYIPDAGPGDYDLLPIIQELGVKNPSYASLIAQAPRDPSRGTDTELFYRYIVNASGKCAVYANLEHASEPVTLTSITVPTAGGGLGVFQAATDGWNGTDRYFQISN